MTKEIKKKKLLRRTLITFAFIMLFVFVLTACNKEEKTSSFFPSDGLDDKGFWIGVNALSYVDLFDYKALTIPKEVHEISDDDIEELINKILNEHATGEKNEIYDREVVKGDLVNISYVGSVDGVEFQGGSTGEEGADVTAGSTAYIDDFLTQIIGHMPGETFNVEVTFPEEYGNEELNGKDAVFITTINYIIEVIMPELNDEFVEANLSGLSTVEELKASLKEEAQKEALREYVEEYITSKTNIKSFPSSIGQYYEDAMLDYYQHHADLYEVDLDEFLLTYVGVSSVEELIANNKEANEEEGKYYLVCQAIAEDSGILVEEDDLIKYLGNEYETLIEDYGLPYLKHYSLGLKVIDYIIDNAVLGED